MRLKTKLFTTSYSFESFINSVLINKGALLSTNVILGEKNLVEQQEMNNSRYSFDAYSEQGIYIDGVYIKGPIVFDYKINVQIDKLNSQIDKLNSQIDKLNSQMRYLDFEKSPKYYTCVIVIYGLSEKQIKVPQVPNIHVIADETIGKWINEYPIDYIKSQSVDRLYNNIHVNKIKTQDFIDYNKYVIDRLKNDIQIGDLSVVLGAGVSNDYKAPSWGELVGAFENEINSLASIEITHLKNKVGSTDLIHAQLYKELLPEDKFYDRLYLSLYENYNPSELLNRETTLYEIGSLLERYSDKKNMKVLTYNYDNFFEQNLNEYFSHVKYKIFYNEEDEIGNLIPIYHIHGYLPYNPYDKKISKKYKDSIKLIEDDYNFLYNNPYSWQIETQLEAFRKNNCLFVGCSLTDPNIRRLLKIAMGSQKRHYAIMCMEDLTHFELVIVSHHFSKMGVDIIWTKKYDDYPEILKNL